MIHHMLRAIAAASLLCLAACGTSAHTAPAQSIKAPISNIVAFMGDSITADWDLPTYDTSNPTLNFGIAGQTTRQMLARFYAVLSIGAGVVVIMGGVNDIAKIGPAANTDSIASMAAKARVAGLRVILCSVMPHTAAWDSYVPPDRVEAFNQKLITLAQQNGYLYADYYDALVQADGTIDAAITKDGLHPNDAGYAKMWAVIGPLIKEDLQ